MPRALRPQIAGATYHVTSRGNRGWPIFGDDADRKFWLGLVEDVVCVANWLCHAYCLLTNHFHLLVETPDANISRGMQRLNSEHAHWFNWRYGYKGHVFGGRFHSVHVTDDAHFTELCRYIALNPLRAGLTRDPERWRWSGYAATLGMKTTPDFLTTRRVLAQFSDDVAEARRVYRDFVEAGIDRVDAYKAVPDPGMSR